MKLAIYGNTIRGDENAPEDHLATSVDPEAGNLIVERFNAYDENQNRISDLQEELQKITHVAKELYGVISEHSLMPCRSLEIRMMATANRYRNRIFGLHNEPK